MVPAAFIPLRLRARNTSRDRSPATRLAAQQVDDAGYRPGGRPVARALGAERAVRSTPVVPVRDLRMPAAARAIGSRISGHSAQMLLAGNAWLSRWAGTRLGRSRLLPDDRRSRLGVVIEHMHTSEFVHT